MVEIWETGKKDDKSCVCLDSEEPLAVECLETAVEGGCVIAWRFLWAATVSPLQSVGWTSLGMFRVICPAACRVYKCFRGGGE